MPLKLTMTEYELHDEGEWLPGTITGIEETEGGQYGPGLKWIILLDGDLQETWAFTGQALTPKARLTKWVRDLDPANPPEVGDVVDLEKYIDARVEVFFERELRDGATKEKVTRVRAAKAQPSVVRQASQKASEAKQTLTRAPRPAPDEEPF